MSINGDRRPDFNAHPLRKPSQKGWEAFAGPVSRVRAGSGV